MVADLAMVDERLDRKMTTAFHAVHQMAQDNRVDNRVAAYLVAVARVAGIQAQYGYTTLCQGHAGGCTCGTQADDNDRRLLFHDPLFCPFSQGWIQQIHAFIAD